MYFCLTRNPKDNWSYFEENSKHGLTSCDGDNAPKSRINHFFNSECLCYFHNNTIRKVSNVDNNI